MKNILILIVCLFSIQISRAQDPAFTVEVSGKGKPVILIPGYSCSGEVWKETVNHLKDRFECHVITIAGYAGVPAVDAPILEKVKQELINYVQTKNLVRPVLIGHSLGAFMSLWASSEAPALFGKVICVDGLPFVSALSDPKANADSLKKSPMYDTAMVVKNFQRLPDSGYVEMMTKAMLMQVRDTSRARQIATWQFNSNRRTLALSIIEMATTDLRPAIASIRQPVLVLGSIYQTKENSYKLLHEQYQNVPDKTIVVADSKHFIMYDEPVWFYSQIDSFLK